VKRLKDFFVFVLGVLSVIDLEARRVR